MNDVLDWARAHDPAADARRDRRLSLSSRLVRFRWDGAPAVAVRAGVSAKARLDAVVDALAWYLDVATPTDDTLHLLLGIDDDEATSSSWEVGLGALGTVAASILDGPQIQVWRLGAGGEPHRCEIAPVGFDPSVLERWNNLLITESAHQVSGLARHLVQSVDAACFALYPKLTSKDENQPWQMRLDGLEIGRIGAESATLALATRDLTKPGEPRDTWRDVIGTKTQSFQAADLGPLTACIVELIGSWSDPDRPTAVLGQGQAEHALEAHLLTGRTRLTSSAGILRPPGPVEASVVRSAQFPTIWDTSRRARYLDALLADEAGRPWAVELKDQDAGGGVGAYLRHGIGQAVLYRHFIRAAAGLDPYFAQLGLQRTDCQAALAFPTAPASAAAKIAVHRRVAAAFGVEVIEFPRPGQ